MVTPPTGSGTPEGPPFRSAALLGLALCILLAIEVGQILLESQEFAPNLGGPRTWIVRQRYWPEAPHPRGDEAEPLADWLGLARYLPEVDLTASQERVIGLVAQQAAAAAREARKGYTRLLEPLTPTQRRRMLEPQPRVVDHRALGLDSTAQDLQVLWLYELDLHAAGAGASAGSFEPPPEPWGLPATRLAVSMRDLLDDPGEPLTPEQARAVLDRMVLLRHSLLALHATHARALALLTDGQRKGARGRELRRWEALPSPQALEELAKLLEEARF